MNGQPAPAAGWFKALSFRPDSGLWATDVEWTEPARTMIAAAEYRYLSAVFSYLPGSGESDMTAWQSWRGQPRARCTLVNDHPEMHATFAGLPMKTVRIKYTVGGSHTRRQALIVRSSETAWDGNADVARCNEVKI